MLDQLSKLYDSAIRLRLIPLWQTVGPAFLTVVIPVVSLGLSILQSGVTTP